MTASWLDVGMVEVSKDGAITLREVNAAESTQARGKLVAVNDDEHFFFTPQLRFANRVNTEMRLEEFYEVSHSAQELSQPVNGKTRAAVVCWRVLGTGVFQSPVDLRHFPFDSQTLAIKLISDWDVRDVRLVRNMKAAYRSLGACALLISWALALFASGCSHQALAFSARWSIPAGARIRAIPHAAHDAHRQQPPRQQQWCHAKHFAHRDASAPQTCVIPTCEVAFAFVCSHTARS